MKSIVLTGLLLLVSGAPASSAQASEQTPATPSFDGVAGGVQAQLEASLAELSRLRETLAAEKIPLTRKLSELERQLTLARGQFQDTTRVLDHRTLDLSNLQSELKARGDEAAYLSNLLGEYIRNFESRLHIAEIQRYREPIEAAKLALENSNLSEQQVFEVQIALVSRSLERLHDALGGTRFEGTAVDAGGLVQRGTIAMIGPAALFATPDGAIVGTLEQRLGSLEPAVIAFADPATAAAALRTVQSGNGEFPFDPTLGNAHKIEATQETPWEHIRRGGPVMVPIFLLAGAALLVALYKWANLAFVRNASRARLEALLRAVARHDREGALREAKAIRGPAGTMLAAGIDHLGEPRELIEEVMYESVLATRLRLQRMLPFIAISASSAPLLGLLGTVTGIMNTFTLMTVFGTGDVKTLSSGISEALITTEYGLIVAIPSLLIHAFLSRKARSVIDRMEQAAVALINQVGKTPWLRDHELQPHPHPTEPVQPKHAAPVLQTSRN